MSSSNSSPRTTGLVDLDPAQARFPGGEVDEGIPLRDEEPAREAILRDLPGQLGVVVGRAGLDLDGRSGCPGIPRLRVVDDQIGQPQQLQPRGTAALAVRLRRAVEIPDPDVEDELPPRSRRIGRELAKTGVVKPVRQLRLQLFDVHVSAPGPVTIAPIDHGREATSARSRSASPLMTSALPPTDPPPPWLLRRILADHGLNQSVSHRVPPAEGRRRGAFL